MPHGTRLGAIAAPAGLFAVSVAFAWLATEVAARALLGPPTFLGKQIVFYHPAPWRADGRGAVRYVANARIRSVAVYGNRIEYDVRFRTNDSGFVDDRDYRRSAAGRGRRIALLGDSFTAGFHGGAPWVLRLRERMAARVPGAELYNLGVGAAGFPNFRELLLSAESDLSFDEIVVLFVSDDLYRPLWRPLVQDGAIYPCPVELSRAGCLRRSTRLFVLPDGEESAEEILALIRQRGLVPPVRGPREWLERHTYLGSLLGPRWRSQQRARARPRLGGWLAWLGRDFADRRIGFLQIPQRNEVRAGRHRLDLSGDFRDAGFAFASLLDRCGFEVAHYYPVDGHLNAAGYGVLARCVGELLEVGWPDSRSE